MLDNDELRKAFNTLSDDQKEAVLCICGIIFTIGQNYKVGNKEYSISQLLNTMNCDQLKTTKALIIMTINDLIEQGD